MKNSMILFGIILAIGVSCQGHKNDMPEEIQQSIKICMAELEITEEEKEEADLEHNFSLNPKFRCMPECVMRTSEIIIDKEINIEKFKSIVSQIHPELDEEKMITMNEKCLGEAEGIEDKCDFALKFEQCMMATIHKQ